MGNKQASQQKPVKKSPHSESLSRLYEVRTLYRLPRFLFQLLFSCSTTSVRKRVDCFPLHKIGYFSSFSLKRMFAPFRRILLLFSLFKSDLSVSLKSACGMYYNQEHRNTPEHWNIQEHRNTPEHQNSRKTLEHRI